MAEGETMDTICGGTIRLVQSARGYRVNLDPVLLAHFAAGVRPKGPAIDLGTGGGVIPLILARKFGWTSVTGLEIQSSLYSLARRNVALNHCEQRVSLALGDLRQANKIFPRHGFAHVLSNPPYRPAARGRASAVAERALARHELGATLHDVAKAARWLLRDRGAFHAVYPAARLAELMSCVRSCRLEPRRLRLVHPREGQPARLVLLTAVKGATTDLCVLPPLVLHEGDAFSEEVQAILGANVA